MTATITRPAYPPGLTKRQRAVFDRAFDLATDAIARAEAWKEREKAAWNKKDGRWNEGHGPGALWAAVQWIQAADTCRIGLGHFGNPRMWDYGARIIREAHAHATSHTPKAVAHA